MSDANALNEDWRRLFTAFVPGELWDSTRLVTAMLEIVNECSRALRELPLEPLTEEEQALIEDDQEDDPRFYDLLFQDEEFGSREIVLEWTEQGVAAVNSCLKSPATDYAPLAEYTVQCWDGIVPEYTYHELAHMTALIAAQLVHADKSFHARTWLFKIPAEERWLNFLKLGQDLDLLDAAQLHQLADRLSR